MSSPEFSNLRSRLLLVGGLFVLAAVLGGLLGRFSVPRPLPPTPIDGSAPKPREAKNEAPPKSYFDPAAPPLFLYVGESKDAAPAVAAEEFGMAGKAGVHQMILPVSLPWTDAELPAAMQSIDRAAAADPKTVVLLEVRCDPPAAWLDVHSTERCAPDGAAQPYASIASAVWRQEAGAKLEALVNALEASPARPRVMGYLLAAHGKGQWIATGGYDRSPAMQSAFAAWLGKQYVDDAALQAAWGDSSATRAGAKVPAALPEDSPEQMFFQLPAQRAQVDFGRFASETTAAAIAELAGHAKAASKSGTRVYAPYGYTLELPSHAAGHYALGALLDGPVDGFVSPVSYADRGLGGAGGPMGPVNSVAYHGKQMLLMDDTRTGVARDAITGSVTRLEGLRAEDVYSVQYRNFAYALVQGFGLIWADPMGEGALHNDDQWKQLAHLREVYANVRPRDPKAPAAATFPPQLTVVLDESSRAYQQCGAPLSDRILQGARDAALRAGVPVHFALLQDVIDGRAPDARVYLFANAFVLTPAQRDALRARLSKAEAYAIWLYAPGYIDGNTASVENIAKTTGIKVAAFDGAAQTGSKFILTARWIEDGQPLGDGMTCAPLFYVDDAESDSLARYTAVEKISVASRFQAPGWTSILVAEPFISPALLREILAIIEQRLYERPGAQRHFDAIFAGGYLLAVHGQKVGERTIDLGGFFDTTDLIDPSIGWAQKEAFEIPLKTGETRLLRLKASAHAPARPPEEVEVPHAPEPIAPPPTPAPEPTPAPPPAPPAAAETKDAPTADNTAAANPGEAKPEIAKAEAPAVAAPKKETPSVEKKKVSEGKPKSGKGSAKPSKTSKSKSSTSKKTRSSAKQGGN